MMAARANVEENLPARLVEYRSDDGNVRQMRAAVIGIIQCEDIAWFYTAKISVDYSAHTVAHAAQVHWHVRSVGNQGTVCIEHRA